MLGSINCSPNKHKPTFCAATKKKGPESKCSSEFFLRTCQDCNINLDESARYLDWEVFITSGNGMFTLLICIVITDSSVQLWPVWVQNKMVSYYLAIDSILIKSLLFTNKMFARWVVNFFLPCLPFAYHNSWTMSWAPLENILNVTWFHLAR